MEKIQELTHKIKNVSQSRNNYASYIKAGTHVFCDFPISGINPYVPSFLSQIVSKNMWPYETHYK